MYKVNCLMQPTLRFISTGFSLKKSTTVFDVINSCDDGGRDSTFHSGENSEQTGGNYLYFALLKLQACTMNDVK